MLEKPNIPDKLIVSHLQNEYKLQVGGLTFLPLGDPNSAVYRVITNVGTAYFLKLRKDFEEISVTVPLFLKSHGVEEIIAPLETKSKQHWADFAEYKMILYPFIQGKNGFEAELTDHHRRILGAAFKKIHTAEIPQELKRLIPQETCSSRWRERVRSFQDQVESKSFEDSTAARLAGFMKRK